MSDDRNPMITGVNVSDLAGLGAVSTEIIKSIGPMVGTVYRPTAIRREGRAATDVEAYQIERRAEAEAKARMIGQGVEDTLRERAGARVVAMETRRQLALEATMDEAVDIAEGSPSEARALEEDWTNAFITHAQEITGEDLRAIWARILASQAQADAATVSRATLDAVRLLEPAMARQFDAAIRMWAAMGQIMHLDDGPEGMMNLHSDEMMALEEIGLLKRYDRNEPNMDFADGVVLSFYHPEQFGHGGAPLANTYPDRVIANVRIERMAPTWRGQELAAVLIPDLYAAMAEADFATVAPGYATQDGRLDILTDWAAQISDRNYLVVLNLLQKEQRGERSVSSLSPRYVMRGDGADWRWHDLTDMELATLRALHPA